MVTAHPPGVKKHRADAAGAAVREVISEACGVVPPLEGYLVLRYFPGSASKPGLQPGQQNT
jgi:hypothetical protein